MKRVYLWSQECDVILARGEQAKWYLDSQLSSLTPVEDALAKRALVLNPDGTLVAPMVVARSMQLEYLLFAPSGSADEVVNRLNRFKLRTKVSFEKSMGSVIFVAGEHEEDVNTISNEICELFSGANGSSPFSYGGQFLVQIVIAGGIFHFPEEFQYKQSIIDSETGRIYAGLPEWGQELRVGMNPTELGREYVRAHADFSKGCYTGQELIERVDSRGYNTPRRLKSFVFRISKEVTEEISVPSEFRLDDKVVFVPTSSYFEPNQRYFMGIGFALRVGGKFIDSLSYHPGTLTLAEPGSIGSVFGNNK